MDEKTLKIIAIVLFIVTYILLLVFSKKRAFIALGAAIIFVAFGILPIGKLFTTINWNLLLMLAGIMGLVCLFIDSKMPAAIGDFLTAKMPNLRWAIIALALFSGIVSAFIDNVATVLIVAPIAIDMCKKAKVSPVAPIIAIAIMSNLQGAATLVGDTTSILLGDAANMNFFDFFFYQGKMGLFWVVQIAMLAATIFLVFFFRKNKQKITVEKKEKAEFIFPSVLLILTVALLIGASFIPEKYQFDLTNGLICVGLFIIGFVIWFVKTKDKNYSVEISNLEDSTAAVDYGAVSADFDTAVFDSSKAAAEYSGAVSGESSAAAAAEEVKPARKKRFIETFKDFDFLTLLLIASLFVIVGGIKEVGIIDDLARFFIGLSKNVFVVYTIIVIASVILSAFIDNIPYVAAMLPMVAQMSTLLGIEPYLLYFGLISGATLGGNLTPIGASANIAALGILRKEGHEVGMWKFMKMSIPFTLIAVLTGYALIWFTWS